MAIDLSKQIAQRRAVKASEQAHFEARQARARRLNDEAKAREQVVFERMYDASNERESELYIMLRDERALNARVLSKMRDLEQEIADLKRELNKERAENRELVSQRRELINDKHVARMLARDKLV
jgi:hypothetical protein